MKRGSFQAYAVLRFQIQINLEWLYARETFPGFSRNGPQTTNTFEWGGIQVPLFHSRFNLVSLYAVKKCEKWMTVG